MSGLPVSSATPSGGAGQQDSGLLDVIQAHSRGPSFQSEHLYPVFGGDGRPAHQPGTIMLPPTIQYSTAPPITQQSLGYASVAFPTQQQGTTLAPSVLHMPTAQALAIPDRSDRATYLDPRLQHTSASAPTLSVGDWMSQKAQTTDAKAQQPIEKPIKKPRQQFSACTACRIRRVKCDLKDLRVEWDKLRIESRTKSPSDDVSDVAATVEFDRGKRKGRSHGKPDLATISKKEDIRCTNCHNRGSKCMWVSTPY